MLHVLKAYSILNSVFNLYSTQH